MFIPAPPAMIRLIGVSKTVASGAEKLTILQSLHLDVAPGEFVAVVGPSGSGKSTLLGLIAGLDAPTTGYIALDREYFTQLDEDGLARLRSEKVGFIFQSFHLIPSLTALENILVPMEIRGVPEAKTRAQALLAEVDLQARGHHYPSQLSGGEQQRIAIARAFANDPVILLADEPTGSLDTHNGGHLFALLLKLNRHHGTTLLLVTHEAALTAQADRVIRLQEGRVVEEWASGRAGERASKRLGYPAKSSAAFSLFSRLSFFSSGNPPLARSPARPLASVRFILNTARREMRASWQRLLLFFLSIAIGVGSIVGVRSLLQNMKSEVLREVRAMYGGDVRVGVNQLWKPETRAILERSAQSPLVTAHTESLELQTMVRAADDLNGRPVMAQLRGVQPSFPLYGEVRLLDGGKYAPELLRERGVLVQPGLLRQTNLKVGDRLKIGSLTFTIRGVLTHLPGNAMQFGPVQRVVMNHADVIAAGLTGFGSRVQSNWYFKTHEGQDAALLKSLSAELRTTRLNWLGSHRHQEDWMTRVLGNWEGFLGLVGLAILVLGGIGIASVTRVFVQQKMKTVAILKCLGGENGPVLSAYILQALALSLVGSLLGLLLAYGITHLAAHYADGRFLIAVVPGLTWTAAWQGLCIGVLVTLLFSLPPLLEIRQVKPILVLRQLREARRRFDWLRLLAGAVLLLGLFGLAFWVSGRINKVWIFMAEVVGAAIVLNLVGMLLIAILRRVRRLPSFVLRQGLGSLCRPGNQTQVILSAVGLGALFLISVRLMQFNLLQQYAVEVDAQSADLFFVDVQKDQRDAAAAMLTQLAGAAPKLVPNVQARMVGIQRSAPRPNVPRNGNDSLGWEMRVSYRAALEPGETIIAGKFWEPTPSQEAEVSLEEGMSENLALGIGDKLTLEINGQRLEAKVTNIRRSERRLTPTSYVTRFNLLFRPGTLEAMPQMFIGALKGPPPGEARAQLQRAFVEQFPNVTMIDAFDIINEIRARTNDLSFAVSFVGGFVFFCGALILAGSVAMTKYQRLYEAAILKTLGARQKLITTITLLEFGVLGLLAGGIGSAAALALTWAICKYELRIPWEPAPGINLAGVIVTAIFVAVVGVMSNWEVLRKKPLGILRSE